MTNTDANFAFVLLEPRWLLQLNSLISATANREKKSQQSETGPIFDLSFTFPNENKNNIIMLRGKIQFQQFTDDIYINFSSKYLKERIVCEWGGTSATVMAKCYCD